MRLRFGFGRSHWDMPREVLGGLKPVSRPASSPLAKVPMEGLGLKVWGFRVLGFRAVGFRVCLSRV